jgi:glycosyltransferase involved in cell wall biosynthesis
VALVIPGRNSASTIERCLEAVQPLLASGALSEILFVNDHSTDDSVERVRQFCGVKVLESPARGAAAARNAGWRATHTDWIWFVDADCVVGPDTLDRLRRGAHELTADAIGGSYSNLQCGRLVAELIHEEMVARHESMGSKVTFAITANLLCRRNVLEQLGGFDESLRLAQDLDLAYRLVEQGYVLAFDSQSRVGHFHETSIWRYCYKQARQGYWRMHLYARHPGRATGDSYSGLLDYAQPPLSVLGAASFLLALGSKSRAVARGFGLLGCSSVALSFLLQLPRTVALVRRTGDPRYLAYAPMGMLRAGFRGAGMSAGLLVLGWQRLRQVENRRSL